ncbi:GAF domain-containing protein [Kwoniella heveanensis BCC8398]|uniref:GAF domain-containing protein n=1 Tax=Kwoniella heveanensis BCC8398 TaxID=1296120 RepID=A0A1B9H212_9TREE|nr:GAF domain-containing protein [Kwoniella heveanensis BCC8398]
MPHADSSYIPDTVRTKTDFYEHVATHLEALLHGERYWVTNLAQTAAILYHSYLACSLYGGEATKPVVNWCVLSVHSGPTSSTGFYLRPPSHPSSPSSASSDQPASSTSTSQSPSSPSLSQPQLPPLLLGPYQGRPACLSINPIKGKGVCADAFLSRSTLIVDDVEAYPGHIACDGETKSEIVLPLLNTEGSVIGVLDLDSTSLGTFGEEDMKGLERIVGILKEGCDWS